MAYKKDATGVAWQKLFHAKAQRNKQRRKTDQVSLRLMFLSLRLRVKHFATPLAQRLRFDFSVDDRMESSYCACVTEKAMAVLISLA
jgi:hypothetical protein